MRAEVVASSGVDLVTELARRSGAASWFRRAPSGERRRIDGGSPGGPSALTSPALNAWVCVPVTTRGAQAAHTGAEAAARIQQRLQAVPARPDPRG